MNTCRLIVLASLILTLIILVPLLMWFVKQLLVNLKEQGVLKNRR